MVDKGNPRMQHLVPRAYLERFADEDGRIRVIARDSREDHYAAVREAGVQRDFYTITRDGVSHYDMEMYLAKVEGEGIKAIRRVCDEDRPLTDEDAHALARLVAFQIPRGLRPRRVGEVVAESLSGIISRHEIGARPEPMLPSRNDHLRVLLHSAERLHTLIRKNLQLVVVALPVPRLVTSDEPVVPRLYSQRRRPGVGVGPATADELWFPLGPRHLLIMSPHTLVEEYIRRVPPDDLAAAVNWAVGAHAYEWIYATPGCDPIGLDSIPPPSALLETASELVRRVDGIGTPPQRKRPRRQ